MVTTIRSCLASHASSNQEMAVWSWRGQTTSTRRLHNREQHASDNAGVLRHVRW